MKESRLLPTCERSDRSGQQQSPSAGCLSSSSTAARFETAIRAVLRPLSPSWSQLEPSLLREESSSCPPASYSGPARALPTHRLIHTVLMYIYIPTLQRRAKGDLPLHGDYSSSGQKWRVRLPQRRRTLLLASSAPVHALCPAYQAGVAAAGLRTSLRSHPAAVG